jgi:CCR4-NOT transcription complex subunit 4
MNGLCPACRRPYDDDKIQYKVITPEETAAHKARQAQKAKKSQAAAQKEKAKAEADNMSRKHLAGLRVVQKNLVYVTGLNPTTQEDQLLQTLRGDQYFGQYGKIIKIVVSKAKDPSNPHSVGVYVTYERKEDAASCIALVDGSKNGDRTLRAQFGTTKYCSSYLRGETCLNRNCMFLHEPGEANESYSRAELSAHNAGSTQHGRSGPPQPQQPLASAAPPMARTGSIDPSNSPPSDRPALPSTASWASKSILPPRAESRAASVSVGSPAVANAVLDPTPSEAQPAPAPPPQSNPAPPSIPQAAPSDKKSEKATAQAPSKPSVNASRVAPLLSLVKGLKLEDFRLKWSPAGLSEADLGIVNSYPPLFDQNGGPRRRARRQREEEQRRMEQEAQAFQQPPAVEADEDPEMSGSLQLGGEPEERQGLHQAPSAIHPPGQEGGLNQRFQFGGDNLNPSAGNHALTQQQLLLQTLKPSASPNFTTSAGQAANIPSTLTQQAGAPGHQRNVSRYSFANDTASASTAVKPVANAKLMNQQSSMMPTTGSSHFPAQQPHSQFYTSNVQGPPPGLKPTGTPPVSGNLTFGQGHGFATGGLQYVAGTTRTQQDHYYRDLMRGGRDATAGGGMDAKREFNSFPHYNSTHPSTAAYPPAGQLNAFATSTTSPSVLSAFGGDSEKQRGNNNNNKKKGKKHRHANTSSSSGGGVVDAVSEPMPTPNHLLQTRLHQQGTAGLGGANSFAGQATGAAAGGLYSVMHGGGGGGYGARW